MSARIIIALASNTALLGTCAYALFRGGRPERQGAVINLVGWVATIGVRLTAPLAWNPGHLTVALIDLTVTLSFFRLAIATTRFWPVWAFGFALADIFASVTAALLPRLPLLVYHSSSGIYADLALASLAIGTWWQSSSGPSKRSAAPSGDRDRRR